MAKSFISWGKDGWKNGTYFLFLIFSEDDQVVGAIDIKSNNLEAGEVGYWVSSRYRGLATNVLAQIKIAGKQAGYKNLFAQTKKGNDKSVNVLLRNGFIEDNSYKGDKCEKAFVCKL